ncbi:hypothetical protein DSO57_1001370 [Entomophthora muscae]|uniref:Uncharacterized protein n=1 Tax=Entomophthora muscae TaxID=34485 RepID=A0ACC2SY99_9FUNG|nr:hypothetical protein DSO57_1001370 [Entomophthora muscae]
MNALEDIYVVERAWLERNKRAPKEMYLLREVLEKKYIQRAQQSIPHLLRGRSRDEGRYVV